MARILANLLAGCVLLAPVLAARDLPDPDTVARNNTPSYATRFMVEFSDSGSSKFRKRDGSADTEGFYAEARTQDFHIIPGQNFTSDVFHGASFTIVNGTNETVVGIESLPEVGRLWPVHLVSIPETIKANSSEDPNRDHLPVDMRNITPHLLTGVGELHEMGFDGNGTIIAIVDTGVAYDHYALGGGFGPGFKVEGGWDLVGPDYLPGDSELNPGPDPMDCDGHGTHVAGIIGSEEPEHLGVAHKARLRAYKVFGCFDGTGSDIVVAAFIQAYEEGADIISGSLGSDNGFAESPIAIVISRIAEQGVLVVTAAGNSGEKGPFLTSNTGNGYGALAVGSVRVDRQLGYPLTAISSSGDNRTMNYFPDNHQPFNLTGEPSAFKGNLSRDFDICGDILPLGYRVPDDDVLFIKRGTEVFCLDTWQPPNSYLINIAKWVIFWNIPEKVNEAPGRFLQDGSPVGFASVNYEDGQWIEDQLEAGNIISFDFSDTDATDLSAAFTSSFSSWGTTLDGRLKPEISAPGDNVWSTYIPRYIEWLRMSGTSMACPYISGVGALFFQSVGGRSELAACGQNPAEVARRRIINSGRTSFHSNKTNIAAAVGQQGAGLVDALKVVEYKTTILPPIVHLNDSDHFSASHTITIRNRGPQSVTYKISHEVGSTAMSREFGDAYIEFNTPLKTDVGHASVEFSTSELTVPAKGKASFIATFSEPGDVDPMILAQYGGEIYVEGSNNETLKVPYIGVRGSMKEAQVWETQHGVPIFYDNSTTTDGTMTQFDDGHVFPFPSLPLPYYNYLWSSREYSFDVVQADWDPSDWIYPPVPGENKFMGSTMFFDVNFQVYRSFPLLLNARTEFNYLNPLGSNYSHGEPIEPGEYRILARAIKTYGDYNKIEDWHTRLSNWFIIDEPKPENSTRSS